AAELLRREGVSRVVCDRSVAFIYIHHLQAAGIHVEYDAELGVLERRAKDEQEAEWLREAQQTTEGAMRMACELVASAQARSDGVLLHEGSPLSSERVRAAIDIWL